MTCYHWNAQSPGVVEDTTVMKDITRELMVLNPSDRSGFLKLQTVT